MEVLIALIVISLGVLGMAGLQLTGMKHSSDGFNRAKATLLTENMATRMRINSTGVKSGLYDNFTSSDADCDVQPDPYCQAYKEGNAERCDIEELAQFDLFSVACGDWSSTGASGGINDVLPEGATLTVNCDDDSCTNESSYTLVATWPEAIARSADEEAQRTRRVQMRLRP